jgi:DinB superfamily
VDEITFACLRDFPNQLEAHYAAIPSGFKNWRPSAWSGIPSEPFTALEQICHVRDIEIDGYHVRFARLLTESNPQLESMDGEALAVTRAYASASEADVLASFRAARAKTLKLLAAVTSEQLSRVGEFEDNVVSLRSMIHLLCSHDQQHLAGLQWLLARIHGANSN